MSNLKRTVMILIWIIILMMISIGCTTKTVKPDYSDNSGEAGMLPKNKLQNIVNSSINNKRVFGTIVNISATNDSWTGASGNLSIQNQYYIASNTKIYITAVIMKLRKEGQLMLEDKISMYLDSDIIKGLHIFKGIDYSNEITIEQLLSQTSGLPDYFQQNNENGISLLDALTSGEDRYWSFEDVIKESKKMKPKFIPGEGGKAYYSDTNYQLLGRIIEIITQKDISSVLDNMIFEPLGLTKTYLYKDIEDTAPAVIYYKDNVLPIPMAMASFGADGGIVSTAEESMIFLKAFIGGELFPKEYFDEMKEWNKIFYPLEYGVGIARFKLPRIFSPFQPFPELIGHSGLSGAFAYYCPEKNVFITGTVNQISNPDISYKLMIKIISSL